MASPAPQRTLVLGASGFLGAHVARAAAFQRGLHQVVCGLRSTPTSETLRMNRVVARPSVPSLPGLAQAFDLRSSDDVRRALERLPPGIVVNCAALSRIADCERDPALARRLNVDAPAEIARWCAANDARFVHVSTDLVFGGEPPRASGYRDDDATDPRSTYGQTKRDGELAVLAADERALVVRLPLLFGDSFGRGLGASDGLVAAIERGETPVLFADEWRTPLDVAEAARALVDLAHGDLHGIVHLPGAVRLSRLELGSRVLELRGFGDPATLVRATTRAEASMGDRPRDVSLERSARIGEPARDAVIR